MYGTIEHLAMDKGYGFIKVEEYEKNLFFHAKDLVKVSFDDLVKGDKVFIEEVIEGPKGFSARGISIKN